MASLPCTSLSIADRPDSLATHGAARLAGTSDPNKYSAGETPNVFLDLIGQIAAKMSRATIPELINNATLGLEASLVVM